jgi:hypothetical protein
MPSTILRNGAIASAMLAASAFAALPVIATEANVDVDAGVQNPATPISPSDTHVEADAGGKDVDVSVDRDPAPRMPQVTKPDVSVKAPGADIEIDRN